MPTNRINIETRIKALGGVVEPEHLETLTQEMQKANGDFTAASTALKDRLPQESLQRLHIADSVITAVGDKAEVVKAIVDQPGIRTLRDVANLNVDKLTARIAPNAKPETDDYKQARSLAVAINGQSFAREPLTVLQRMTSEGEIPIANENVRTALVTFLKRIPAETDIRITPIHKVLTEDALKDIAEEHRTAVVDQAKALWRTLAVTPPDAPHVPPILMKTNLTSAFHIGEKPESTFLRMYGKEMGEKTAYQVYTNAINARIRNEQALITMREAIRGAGLAAIDGSYRMATGVQWFKDAASKNDIRFNLDTLFGDMDYCECKECQSVYSASAYFVELLNFLRNNDLGPDPATGADAATNPNIHPGIKGTPLEKLFLRRPDLGDLELTCENTTTILPYIDLVNEVMESYVVHRTEWAASKPKLDAFNVIDETKDELLAQPQHTNYLAYCILKNEAVYPFTLPFHQPIEAARIFLKYLGTSRYEVLDSFRAAHEVIVDRENMPKFFSDACNGANQNETGVVPRRLPGIPPQIRGDLGLDKFHNEVLDRAVDAEFLGLTQEEYIILTKEAFWPKKYFEMTQNTTYSDEQYRKNIGVKDPWIYYGYNSKDEMVDPDETHKAGLPFVKRQFLPRTGIQYTDLIESLKTRFINPPYPNGLVLAILENIKFTYRFLQAQVDTKSTDPKVRFAKLIDYLENKQSWSSVPEVMKAFRHRTSPEGEESRENRIIRQWVYCCFEKLGKLIVLESGDNPQLPIAGKVYKYDPTTNSAGALVGTLHKDGTIEDLNGAVIGNVQFDMTVVWKGGSLQEIFGVSELEVFDENNQRVGSIFFNGLRGKTRTDTLSWIPAKDTCDLDKVRLVHLDGSPVTVDELDRTQRFIRLWRKLGWTIDEVDKAMVGLAAKSFGTPAANESPRGPHVDFNAFRDRCLAEEGGVTCCGDFTLQDTPLGDITPDFLLQLMAVKKLLERTGLPLMKLLSFWANISTAGEKSLYASLFLSHNMVGIDKVFESDDNGNYLAGTEKISDHLPVLIAALKLNTDAVTAVLAILGLQLPDALLTLENVSAIYRHGLLAKALQIRVSDLANLKAVFGEPFTDAVTTLKLFKTWEEMEDAGFAFRQLTYVIKDLDNAKKPLAPSQKTILKIAKALYDGLNAIDRDNQDVTDVVQATAEWVRAEAGQIFDPGVVEQIVGLLEGTTVHKTNASGDLKIAISDPKPSWADKLKYFDPKDDKGNSLGASVEVTGILTTKDESDVKALFATHTEWSKAIDRVRKQATAFFNDVLAGILPSTATPDDDKNNRVHPLAGDVIIPVDQIADGQPDPNTAPKKRLFFLYYFLPKLRQWLEERFITETISTATGLASDATKALLLEVKSSDANPLSAMEALRSVKEKSAPQSGQPGWTGYLIPPADGKYAFVTSVPDANPDVPPLPLTIEGIKVEFLHQQDDPTNVWSTDPVTLKAGTLYLLTIADRDATKLSWRTTGSPASQIPTSALLPDFTHEGTKDVYIRLSKAAIVVNSFNLSADEVFYFQEHGSDFGNFDFNSVSLDSWRRIADYVSLRKSLPKAGMSLLDLFGWACKPDDATKLVGKLDAVTQWKEDRIKSLMADNHFDLNRPAAFQDERNLVKMQKAIAVADKVGVDIDRLFYWAVPGSKYWPCHQIAEDIRMAMRGRFDAEDFEKAVKPLSDQLREMQEKALVSYLLVQPFLINWGVVDADSLFEFFLIDVQMGTERQTSRMVQAIASVQLFIKRCLMGLEEKYGVSSDVIDRNRWEWMQKYRVWEANRKVFLYPENWIRPELRDDKSPFYKELESELLQKDINTQTVEDVLRNYLYEVDEVANMRVVGLFLEGEKKLHVFARTHNAPYFFYYRYYDIKQGNWYPWEKVQVDIPGYDLEKKDGDDKGRIIENGSYLTPVVWNNRLLLFFPQIVKKTMPANNNSGDPTKTVVSTKTDDDGNIMVTTPSEFWEIKMAWSEYRNGKWTQKQVSKDALLCPIIKQYFEPSHLNQFNINQFVFLPAIDEDKIVIKVRASSHELTIQEKLKPAYVTAIEAYFWWVNPGGGDALDPDARLNIKVYKTSDQIDELMAQKLNIAGWGKCNSYGEKDNVGNEIGKYALELTNDLTLLRLKDIQNGSITLEIFETGFVFPGVKKEEGWGDFIYQLTFTLKDDQGYQIYTSPEWRGISLNTNTNNKDEKRWSNLTKA